MLFGNMPRKLNGEKPIPVSIRLTLKQAALVDKLVEEGLYGSSRPEVLKYFVIRELERVTSPLTPRS